MEAYDGITYSEKKKYICSKNISKVNGHASKKIFKLKRRRSFNQMPQVNLRVISSRLEWIRQFYDGSIALDIGNIILQILSNLDNYDVEGVTMCLVKVRHDDPERDR